MLEDILKDHSIDADPGFPGSLDSRVSTPAIHSKDVSQHHDRHSAPSPSARIEDLCKKLEGALSLDDTLNWDQDGEAHYFGPTSGRLEFIESCELSHPAS